MGHSLRRIGSLEVEVEGRDEHLEGGGKSTWRHGLFGRNIPGIQKGWNERQFNIQVDQVEAEAVNVFMLI